MRVEDTISTLLRVRVDKCRVHVPYLDRGGGYFGPCGVVEEEDPSATVNSPGWVHSRCDTGSPTLCKRLHYGMIQLSHAK